MAKVAVLVARGELDIQAGQNLSTLAKAWLDSQYLREELAIKQFNAGTTEHEQVIRVEGGLPPLPGCNVTMPLLDGKPMTNGHALEPPPPAVPAIEAAPKAQDPEPPPQDPEL